jgi:hypothetical protein
MGFYRVQMLEVFLTELFYSLTKGTVSQD